MTLSMHADSSDVEDLISRAASGDPRSWAELVKRYRSRLRRMVGFRMDPRLQGRVDPSDVVQDVCLEAWQHLGSYAKQPDTPFFVWLRAVAGHKLVDLHRHHLGTRMRDARREVSLYQGSLPGATSAALAAQLLGRLTCPSEAAVRAERKVQLQTALNAMDAIDREVLALRHFEQLTVGETAAVLGIKEKAAGMRYVRALRRLKEILTNLGGWAES
ncbi:MAG TPA: sigma-70 family RNA polymerase sigma factor [Isosphaeraceae bacterium]|nr:sigma-70 family RNA polymerase sigma factor [Isosphaeraceae bacterium]